MERRIGAVLVFLVAALGCGDRQEPAVDVSGLGEFEEAACAVPLPEGFVEGQSVRCGWVRVPEHHAEPGPRTMDLPVMVFRSSSENPAPDPLVVTMAGPGASAVASFTPVVATPVGLTLLSRRDLVLVDTRGLPMARPNLVCPEVDEAFFATLTRDLSAEEVHLRIVEGIAACRDRLVAEGLDLAAFTAAEAAADLAMVLRALGYERYNLYGSLAGTLVVQEAMRHHGDLLRSVILDQPVPAGDAGLHRAAPSVAADALERLIEGCESDPGCAAAFPDVRAKTEQLVARFNAEPLVVEAVDPTSGEPAGFHFNGDRLAHGIRSINAQTGTVPAIPAFIHELSEGRVAVVSNVGWAFSPPPPPYSHGVGYSVFCSSIGGIDVADLEIGTTFPDYQRAVATDPFGISTILTACDTWGVEPEGGRIAGPVTSDVPTLIIAGRVDSQAPPSWAHEVSRGLADSQVSEIPGYAQSAAFSGPCPFSLMFQFLNDPTAPPDESCIAEMELRFLLPE